MADLFRFVQACIACGKPTHEACDNCKNPACGHGACLFQTGRQLTFPPDPADEYPQEWQRPEELCMTCYIEREGHPPFSLWADTGRHSVLSFKQLIHKGSIAPADDAHSWYRPPSAGKMLLLQWANKTIEYDTYDVVQLLNFLLAHDQAIRTQAKETADVLIPESHKQTEATMRADAGCVDYSQYE